MVLANMYSYFKLAFAAKLYLVIIIIKHRFYSHASLLIETSITVAGNNLQKNYYEIFVYQKILVFTKFLCYENLVLYGIIITENKSDNYLSFGRLFIYV